MRANRLPARQGLRWIGQGFMVVRAAPIRLLLLHLAFLLAITVTVAIPVVGFAAVWLLVPALVIGPHAMARAAARGAVPGPELLLAGFRANPAMQLRLGGVYLAAMIAVLAATTLADDGHFAQAMVGRVRLQIGDLQNPEVQQAMLIGAVLQTAALTALWYAPLLVAWNGLSVSKAAFFSAAAALINWRPFLVYGAGITLLFAFALMLALGAAMLFAGPRAAQGNAALFAVIWILLPIWFASSYLSYRDVFEPANSPTIPS
jgi:hypothetical protein